MVPPAKCSCVKMGLVKNNDKGRQLSTEAPTMSACDEFHARDLAPCLHDRHALSKFRKVIEPHALHSDDDCDFPSHWHHATRGVSDCLQTRDVAEKILYS